jgi:hypothetical protein
MTDNPVKTLSDILIAAAKQFKGGKYDDAIKTLQSKGYAEAINALDGEQHKGLKATAASIFEHMGIAASSSVRDRIDDKKIAATVHAINFIDKQIEKDTLSPKHLTNLSGAFSNLVHQIDKEREFQSKLLTQHESELLGEGLKNRIDYNINLIGRRWSDAKNIKDIEIPPKEVVQKLTETTPEIDLLSKGNGILGGGNPFEQLPKTNVQTETILEGRALEEFGGVKILDNNWKKVGAGIAIVAGVGIAAHGVYNVYQSFVNDPNEKLEVAEIGHEKPTNGVNWLRLVVGATEIGAGSYIAIQNLTGRNPFDMGKPVKGTFTALCNHGGNAQAGGRGT